MSIYKDILLGVLIMTGGLLTGCRTSTISANEDKLSPLTRQLVESIIDQKPNQMISDDVIERFGLMAESGGYVVNGLIKVAEDFDELTFEQMGVKQRTNAGSIRTVSIPINKIAELSNQQNIKYIEIDNSLSRKKN